jgi:hypothetical protein
MAKPILKIKTGISGKPGNYTQTLTNGIVTATSGLTAGELGANLAAESYGFYIGNTFGQAITFGCEVTIDPAFITPSDAKIPTQKALKTYIAVAAANAGAPVRIMSKYSAANLSVGSNTIVTQLFASDEFTSTFAVNAGVADLTYNNSDGRFTNNTTSTINLLICYQITWTGVGSNRSYNSSEIVRSAWIQKSGSVAIDNIYGFTSLLCPPIASTTIGAITGTQNGSATITLQPAEYFTIQCKNHGTGASTTTNTATIGTGIGGQQPITNFNRATRIQIVKV